MTQARKKKGGAAYHHGNLKRELLDGALAIIRKQGRQGLTLRAVANAAQVSRTAPYRHFKNKEAILAAVAEEGFEELACELSAIAQREEEPLERIILQGSAYVALARENPERFEVMFGFKLESYFLYPSLLEKGMAAASCLFESVRQCQEAGIVKEGDPLEIGFGAWTLIHGLSTLLINGLVPFDIEGEGALEALVRSYSMSFLQGMGKNG